MLVAWGQVLRAPWRLGSWWGCVRVDLSGCCIELQGLPLHWQSPTSLTGPWSDKEASPTFQINMSDMATGPVWQPLQDFILRTLLTGSKNPSLSISPVLPSFSLFFFFMGVGWEELLFLYYLLWYKTRLSCLRHTTRVIMLLCSHTEVEGGQARATASSVLRTWLWELVGAPAPTQPQPLLHPIYKGGRWGSEMGNSWIRVLAGLHTTEVFLPEASVSAWRAGSQASRELVISEAPVIDPWPYLEPLWGNEIGQENLTEFCDTAEQDQIIFL